MSWYKVALADYWFKIGQPYDGGVAGETLNLEGARHVVLLTRVVQDGFSLGCLSPRSTYTR